MPLYDYECKKCETVHEVTQKMSEPVLTECPVCQSKDIKKLLSLGSFALKGTGFYTTDYKRQGAAANSASAGASASTPATGAAPSSTPATASSAASASAAPTPAKK